MGIAGLYQELPPAPRHSLAKLSSDHFATHNRRLRLAIDASIWSFQAQSTKGGQNPALRTLYYRLLRLLHLNVHPLFVFDGPRRPAFKRNHKTNTTMTPSLTRNTKALLKLFGFPWHDAPGEAEAECANLQRCGVVDAVLSEDVDTLMFGCGLMFREWSAEGPGAASRAPTHVSVYERERVGGEGGITPAGMILVALMRGGDYLPEGVPRCGIKIAAEAAKAGFGEDLYALDVDDDEGFAAWRARLQAELETNRSGYFKRKNRSIRIPAGFPDRTVLGYYKCPAVSSAEKVGGLRESICWTGSVDVPGLRESVRWAFEWRGKIGAAKFVRSLAPALFSWNLCTPGEDVRRLVNSLHGSREHPSTGACRELRVSFVPANIVQVDMHAEADDDVEVQLDEDDEFAGEGAGRKAKDYDPYALERVWVLEDFARRTIPDLLEAHAIPKSKPKPKPKTTKRPRKEKQTPAKPQREPSSDVASLISHLTDLQITNSRAPLTSNRSSINSQPPQHHRETSQDQENLPPPPPPPPPPPGTEYATAIPIPSSPEPSPPRQSLPKQHVSILDISDGDSEPDTVVFAPVYDTRTTKRVVLGGRRIGWEDVEVLDLTGV